jgi:hypothetical protein
VAKPPDDEARQFAAKVCRQAVADWLAARRQHDEGWRRHGELDPAGSAQFWSDAEKERSGFAWRFAEVAGDLEGDARGRLLMAIVAWGMEGESTAGWDDGGPARGVVVDGRLYLAVPTCGDGPVVDAAWALEHGHSSEKPTGYELVVMDPAAIVAL